MLYLEEKYFIPRVYRFCNKCVKATVTMYARVHIHTFILQEESINSSLAVLFNQIHSHNF